MERFALKELGLIGETHRFWGKMPGDAVEDVDRAAAGAARGDAVETISLLWTVEHRLL